MTRRRLATAPALALALCLAASGCNGLGKKDAAKSLHEKFDALIAAGLTDEFTAATFAVDVTAADPVMSAEATFVRGTSVTTYRDSGDGKVVNHDDPRIGMFSRSPSTAVASLRAIDLDSLLKSVQDKKCAPWGDVKIDVLPGGLIYTVVGCPSHWESSLDGKPVEKVPTDPSEGIPFGQRVLAGMVENSDSVTMATWKVDHGHASIDYRFGAPRGTSMNGSPCIPYVMVQDESLDSLEPPIAAGCAQPENPEFSLAAFNPEIVTKIQQAVGAPTSGYVVQLAQMRRSGPTFIAESPDVPKGMEFDLNGEPLK